MSKNIIIIGNGSIISKSKNEKYINHDLGVFFSKLFFDDDKYTYTYVDFELNSSDKDQNLDFNLDKERINYIAIDYNGKKSIFRTVIALIKVIKNSDFIYLFYPGSLSLLASIISIVLNKNYALYLRGELLSSKRVSEYILRRSKFILTVAPYFINKYQQLNTNIYSIKPMIDFDRKDITNDYNYDFTFYKFLYVGRIEKRKGIVEIIEICKYLESINLSFEFNLVGHGDMYQELVIDKKKGLISDKIILHGRINDVNKLEGIFKNSNTFIFTSHDEGFPRVLYEAMIFGLPIFTTFVGGIKSRMIDGFNCIKLPLRDGKTSGLIIGESLKDKKKMRLLAYNGSETVSKILTEEKEHHILLKKCLDDFN